MSPVMAPRTRPQAPSSLPGSGDPVADSIVEAAIAEVTDHGFRRVTVDDIARRAGLHRVTVYKRFANKDAVTIAAMMAWVQRYFTSISDAVEGLPVADALVEGFVLSMQSIRKDPLVARLLERDPETVLPFLTVKGGPAIAVVRDFFADRLRGAGVADPDGAAEVAARIGLSFLLTPDSHFSLESPDEIRAFARRFLLPLLDVAPSD